MFEKIKERILKLSTIDGAGRIAVGVGIFVLPLDILQLVAGGWFLYTGFKEVWSDK